MTDEYLMDNPRSERVKRVAALATRAGRKKHNMFLAEGPQPVREALKLWLARYEPQDDAPLSGTGAGPGLPELDALFFDPAAIQRFPDVEALLDRLRGVLFNPTVELPRDARPFLREATPQVLAAMGDAETSQGMIAVARIPEASSDFGWLESTTVGWSESVVEASNDTENPGRGVVATAEHPEVSLVAGLVRVQDPGNVGTIIRTADAAGADVVVLSSGSADPWSPKVVRAAAGSHFHLPIFTGIDIAEYAHFVQPNGIQVLAAAGQANLALHELSSPSTAGQRVSAAGRTLWLFGNEAQGLSAHELALADAAVSIPIYGQAESLNVSTAATLCLYATATAQDLAPVQDDPAEDPAPGAQVEGWAPLSALKASGEHR